MSFKVRVQRFPRIRTDNAADVKSLEKSVKNEKILVYPKTLSFNGMTENQNQNVKSQNISAVCNNFKKPTTKDGNIRASYSGLCGL